MVNRTLLRELQPGIESIKVQAGWRRPKSMVHVTIVRKKNTRRSISWMKSIQHGLTPEWFHWSAGAFLTREAK
jgi:hypothetical protein